MDIRSETEKSKNVRNEHGVYGVYEGRKEVSLWSKERVTANLNRYGDPIKI